MESVGTENLARPTVILRQGVVLGTVLSTGLKRTVEAFRGIPYALPPTGDRRFRRPVKVRDSSDIIDAGHYGPSAYGCKSPTSRSDPLHHSSEDCLTANVFRHATGKKQELLPVMIYFHGGAFNRGTASMHNTASFVSWSEEPFVAVSFNYRLGALGFLPSRLSAQEGILNLGLWDQILLLEWVQENIAAFGGDKTNVTLVGVSAGAHSIGHHILRHNNTNAGPFHRAILESGAPTSRALLKFDAELCQNQFQDLLQCVGCPKDLPEALIFQFLRSIPIETIAEAQSAVFEKYNGNLRWAFQPVMDGELIIRPPIETLRLNQYYHIPVMTGHTTNEGSLHVDRQVSTADQFISFFHHLLPHLSHEDLCIIERLYPDPESSDDKIYKVGDDMVGFGAQYKRLEAAYGQYAYVAPVWQTVHLASMNAETPVYLYHWAPKSSILGASHGDTMRYETFDEAIVSYSASQRALCETLHAYIVSFICKDGDPNALASQSRDRPKWERYRYDCPKSMVFGRNNEELIGGEVGITAEMVRGNGPTEQCQFWWKHVDIDGE